MMIYEYKLDGRLAQFAAFDEAIRTTQFIRNKCVRLWKDGRGVTAHDLNVYCAALAKEFDFARLLNSQARQAAAERAASAILRFYKNCRQKKPGKKGYPRFQKDCRSIEYKTTGRKLDPDGKHITFTDGFQAGRLRLLGKRDLTGIPLEKIKRVRVLRRADGYYAQLCLSLERSQPLEPSGNVIGLDMGLAAFTTDSNGGKVACPSFLRKAEKKLKRLQRRISRKQKGSGNRKKARARFARKHLQVTRQRRDFAIKLARCVVLSNDMVAVEDLQVRNMVRNPSLAKSISDASWTQFRNFLVYYAKVYGRQVVAVPPHYTSQDCSACGRRVKKALSTRTHICKCGLVVDRDENAAINILALALGMLGCFDHSTAGHAETDGSNVVNACGELAATCVSEKRGKQVFS